MNINFNYRASVSVYAGFNSSSNNSSLLKFLLNHAKCGIIIVDSSLIVRNKTIRAQHAISTNNAEYSFCFLNNNCAIRR